MDELPFSAFPGDVELNVASLALDFSVGKYGSWKSAYYQRLKNCRSGFPARVSEGNRG